MTCQGTLMHPFTRVLYRTSRFRQGFGCYSSRLSDGRELYIISVHTAEGVRGTMSFDVGKIDVRVYRIESYVGMVPKHINPMAYYTSPFNIMKWRII